MSRQPKTAAEIIAQVSDTNALIIFEILGQPVAKARPRLGRYGGIYTPTATTDQEERIRWAFLAAGYSPQTRTASSFALLVRCYFKGKALSDWDNLGKLVSDALNGMVWKDDRQVTMATVEKFAQDPNPRTEVRIWRRA